MFSKLFFSLILILAFSPAGLYAQHDWDFKDWDEIDDNFIAKDEMKKAWKTYYIDLDDDGVFEAWDVNVDGTLSRDEFIDGAFIIYDTDRDGNIDAAECREYRDGDK